MKKEVFIEIMQEKSINLGVRFLVEQTEQFFEYMNLLITIGSTIVYSVLIIWFMFKRFKSEKVLFSS